MTNLLNYQQKFKEQKSLTKSKVLALLPGTLLELKWLDGPNTFGFLLEKPKNNAGDVSLFIWYPEITGKAKTGSFNQYAGHNQVVGHSSVLTVSTDGKLSF
jgi:hypothetical protein